MIAGQRSPRNPSIVEVLRDYGYVDARGMGVRKQDHSAPAEAQRNRAGIHCDRGSSEARLAQWSSAIRGLRADMQPSPSIERSGNAVIEALVGSLAAAAKYNPNDVVHPYAVLWTDHDAQWQPIIPQLRRLLPQLLTFGEYQPDQRIGPAIWLRCVVDRGLPEVELPDGATPIVYLPGVSRQELRAVQECPDSLKPLVELQYRGACWTQKTARTGRLRLSWFPKKAGSVWTSRAMRRHVGPCLALWPNWPQRRSTG